MVLTIGLGNALSATPVIVSTTMRPSSHVKRTVREAHRRINAFRRNPPINLIPQLQWSPLCKNNRRTWTGKGILLGSINTPFQRPWEKAAAVFVYDDSFAALDAGVTANLVRPKWQENHNSHMQKTGIPKVSTYPTMARFEFGRRRVKIKVSIALDILVGIAGCMGRLHSVCTGGGQSRVIA